MITGRILFSGWLVNKGGRVLTYLFATIRRALLITGKDELLFVEKCYMIM